MTGGFQVKLESLNQIPSYRCKTLFQTIKADEIEWQPNGYEFDNDFNTRLKRGNPFKAKERPCLNIDGRRICLSGEFLNPTDPESKVF